MRSVAIVADDPEFQFATNNTLLSSMTGNIPAGESGFQLGAGVVLSLRPQFQLSGLFFPSGSNYVLSASWQRGTITTLSRTFWVTWEARLCAAWDWL